MATPSSMDSNLQKYEIALDRLGENRSSRKQRPIVERGKLALSQQEAVSAARQRLWRRFGTDVRQGPLEEIDERVFG
jgi:hypothetical protein